MEEQELTPQEDFEVIDRNEGYIKYIGAGGDVVVPPVVEGCVVRGLYCSDKDITTLDISHVPELRELDCCWNPLTTLDTSRNPALTHLDCSDNNLTTLNLSNNPALKWLSCFSNNLVTLNISTNPNLTTLICEGNPLATLDLSHNPKLLNGEDFYVGPNVQVQTTPQRAPEKPSFADAKAAAVGARDAGVKDTPAVKKHEQER